MLKEMKLKSKPQQSSSKRTLQYLPMKPLARDWCRILEKRYDARPQQDAKSSSSLAAHVFNVLKPGKVATLFSEPGAGATLFFTKVLEGYFQYNLPVLLSSPAADWMPVISRLAAIATGVPAHRIQTGDLTQDDFPNIVSFIGNLENEDVYFTNERDLVPIKIQKEMKLWKNKENKKGIFLFDNYCEMEGLDFPLLENLRSDLKKLAIDCNVPIIANVKIKSMGSLYEEIRPCRNQQMFNLLRNSGSNIFLVKNHHSVDAFFLSKEIGGAKNLRISVQHDKAALDLLY